MSNSARTTIVLSAIMVMVFTYVIWSDTNDSIELSKSIAESGQRDSSMMATHDAARRVDEIREEIRILKKGKDLFRIGEICKDQYNFKRDYEELKREEEYLKGERNFVCDDLRKSKDKTRNWGK